MLLVLLERRVLLELLGQQELREPLELELQQAQLEPQVLLELLVQRGLLVQQAMELNK